MDASLYHPLYFILVGIFCLIVSFRYMESSGYTLQAKTSGLEIPLIISVFLILWLGNRPISGAYFGDTLNYALGYSALEVSGKFVINLKLEWLWELLSVICKSLNLSISGFLTIIIAGYLFFSLWAVKRFTPSNTLIGILFILSSLMFYNFGVNGLRNGLACSMVLVAISYFLDNKYLTAFILTFLAFGIHKSILLPVIGVFAAKFIFTNYKYAVYLWAICIPLSLFSGSYFLNLFNSFSIDDRISGYVTSQYNNLFSSTGFRWDFLLYSVPPIIFSWYIIVKKKIHDNWFNAISITYCLCNAFWILIIRIAFTNRFAYLSWFLYPIIFSYALINLPIWKDQDRKIGIILAAYCCFTLIIQMIVW